jgi:hypothetical protein
MMFKKSLWILVLSVLICCGPTVLVPPEVDLISFERVGLISFSLEGAEGRLDELATQRLLQEITFHQRGVQIIEMGTLGDVLEKIDKNSLDQEAVTAIGEHFGVTSFIYGKINVSEVKPQVDIGALIRRLSISAAFTISATARFVSTETGATLWTDSVSRKDSLAFMSMGKDQIPYFDVRDQEEAYRELIERLIHDLSRDFRPTKRRL